jgi:glutamate N-acetyltransferase/amino-acid N-acetyltransferase
MSENMMNYKSIEGGVCAPAGYTASGVAAGIKKPGSPKLDSALVFSDRVASAAGAFTKNLLKSAPTKWTEGVCIRGEARAIFLNSGNSNAVTGQQGVEDTQRMAECVSGPLNIPISQVCVLSTGVIGVPLPMDRVEQGIAGCIPALSIAGGDAAATAIMTTDTVKKEMAIEVPLSGGTVRMGAMSKGSGMIRPDMATMFCIVTCDAAIESELLSAMLKRCVALSFNCICVDNDMSTSDAVVCLCNGAAGVTVEAGTADAQAFEQALLHVCIHMAQWLVRDGEGATKYVEIEVTGTEDDEAAKTMARSVAQSQLCKTAFAGEDANWGRIACAVGYAGVHFQPERLSVTIGGVEVLYEGLPTDYAEADAAAVMKQKDIRIVIKVGEGPGFARFWTSDLTHDYISINADYRT